MTDWQPIETAPKTTRAILVWVPENKCTFAVWWDSDHEMENRESRPCWKIWGGGYRSFLDLYNGYRPTHWQPLPEPPK